nr:l-type lectin-domain containing receptor kinase s.4 [Quercus suber]
MAVDGESSNGDADVVVDLEDLILVRGDLEIGLGKKSRDLERKLGMEVAKKRRREDKKWNLKKTDVVEAWELDIGPHRFSYEDLKKAT